MKNKLLTIVFFTLAFSACFNCQQGDEGTLIINFGGGRNGRSAGEIQWPPSSLDGDNIYFSYPTKFIVTLSSPTGKREEIFYFQEGTPYTDTKISLAVTSGLWNILLETIIYDSFLYAAGSRSVDIKAGQVNSVPIEMKRKYYKIGEGGPGGGLIFYVAPKGFDLQDIDPANIKRCHYLEAARLDFPDTTGNYPSISSSLDFYVPYTSDNVGEGRRNTQIIVNELKEDKNMAAQLCVEARYGGFNDWFLPSYDELNLMYENLYLNNPSLGSYKKTVAYWSSSFAYNTSMVTVKGLMFFDGLQISSSPNDSTNCTRAIRAF